MLRWTAENKAVVGWFGLERRPFRAVCKGVTFVALYGTVLARK